MSFWVEESDSDVKIANKMSELFWVVRQLLGDATRQLGCGINPLKSENVAPKAFCEYIDTNFEKIQVEDMSIFKGKHIVKWLGYFLELDTSHNLKFNEEKINKHINSICHFRDQMYQYTSSVGIKWRIFKTFIAPYIELYLPLVVQHKVLDITAVHKLQHQSMCRAIGVPITASRKMVELRLGERSVAEKANRMFERLITSLAIPKPDFGNGIATRTRNRGNCRNILSFSYDSNENKNFITRLFVYQDLEFTKRVKVKFDTKKVKRWARAVCAAIKTRSAR